MRKLSEFRFLLPALALFICIGCSAKKNPPTAIVEEDTRILVKRAYDSADRAVVKSIFNTERALSLKTKVEQEKDPGKPVNLKLEYANELLKSGNTKASTQLFQKILDFVTENKFPLDSATKRNLLSTVGIAYMRLGETENCIQNHNHQSCYIPI